MDVSALIDAYIHDVTQLMPRSRRSDVAMELRGLIREELDALAASRQCPLDTAIALDGLRAFGRPQEVAARYDDPWIIIPPTETRRFVFAAVLGAAVLVALSPLSDASALAEQLGAGMFAWLGILLTYFGVQSFRNRRKHPGPWVPRDADRASRTGSLLLIAVIGVGILCYASPGAVFAWFTHGQTLSAWLNYDPAFRSFRLPWLFVLWGCQAIVLAVVTVRGRTSPTLRRMQLGFQCGVALALIGFVAAGKVFMETEPNQAALSVMSVIALGLLLDAAVKVYRNVNRESARMVGA